MSRRMSIHLSKNVNNSVSLWDTAISDAESKIQAARQQVARLQESIKMFKRLRDSGEPFPVESAEQGKRSVNDF